MEMHARSTSVSLKPLSDVENIVVFQGLIQIIQIIPIYSPVVEIIKLLKK